MGKKNGLFKVSSVYLISNILNALVPFVLLPVFTRYLSPSEYGQIAMFQTLVTGLAAVIGLNAVGAANRKYYDHQAQKEFSLFNGACIHILSVSMLVFGIMAALMSNMLSNWLNIPRFWIYLAIIISGANFVVQLRLGQWQMRKQAVQFGMLQVSQGIGVLLLSLILVVGLQEGALGRIAAMLMVAVLYAVISFWSLFRDRLLVLSQYRPDHINEALRFGIPLVPHVLGIFFLSSIDRFLINQQLGVAEAGIYMLAVQLSLGMAIVFDAINKAMVPWLFNALSENNPEVLQRVVRLTYVFFIVVLALGGLSFWVGPWVVHLVAGPAYGRAASVIGWLCLGQAFGGMYLMVTNYIFYAKRTGRLSCVTISLGIFNVMLLLYLMKLQGIVGVAMAFAIAMCLRFLATWWLALQTCHFSWRLTRY